MSTTTRNVIDAVIFLILFYLIQIVFSILAMLDSSNSPLSITLCYGASSVVTILLFYFAKFSPLSSTYIKSHPWALLAWMSLLTLSLIAPMKYFEELIPSDMPSSTVATLVSILSHPLGFLVVGILTPIAEEMVFRGAILRKLLPCVRNPWIAIVISAAVFGIAHGNLPQFIHATLMGTLLGWTYWRTRSILPALVVHWVNNLTTVALCRMNPDNIDATLPEMFGGNLTLMYSAIAVSVIVAIISLWRVVRELR